MSDLDEVRGREWFYEFALPDGTSTTPNVPEDVATIHPARWEMIERVLASTFGDDLAEVEAIDFACHQGWLSTQLLAAGVRSVRGVDARPENVGDAALMARVLGYEQPRAAFELFDVGDPRLHPLDGEYDVALMLGLLYHLENPVGALRVARRHCRRLCLVETQIAPSLGGVVDWGSYRWTKEIVGNLAVVDETP